MDLLIRGPVSLAASGAGESLIGSVVFVASAAASAPVPQKIVLLVAEFVAVVTENAGRIPVPVPSSGAVALAAFSDKIKN